MKKLLFFASLPFLLTTCDRGGDVPLYIEWLNTCIKNSEKESPKKQGGDFVEFKLKGERILINDGENGYNKYCDVANTFLTYEPVLNPSTDTSKQYLLRMGFHKYSSSETHAYDPGSGQFSISLEKKEPLSTIEFIDKYIKLGDLKLKRKLNLDKNLPAELNDGFEIVYWCGCYCVSENPNIVYVASFNSTAPDQDGFLRCTKLERTDLGGSVRYEIEFKFACTLYANGTPMNGPGVYEPLGKLQDGVMAMVMEIQK